MQRAHVYIVSCGVNDVTHGVAVDEFAGNLAAILDELRAKSPRAAILYGGLPPLECFPALRWPLKAVLAERVRELRAAAAVVIDRHKRAFHFQFPPAMSPEHFASDGFHPHEKSCEQWAAGLLALKGASDLRFAVNLLASFSSLVAPPLGQAIAIADKVSGGIESLLNDTHGEIHLPFHQIFASAGGGRTPAQRKKAS